MRKNGVRYLLMGGQACVFYGAAEFSRDLNLVIFLADANLDRLRRALADLDAARNPVFALPFVCRSNAFQRLPVTA
jgi:hypothetical protein